MSNTRKEIGKNKGGGVPTGEKDSKDRALQKVELSDEPKAHGASNSPKPNPKLNTDDGGNTTGSPTGGSLKDQKEHDSQENKTDTDTSGKPNGDKIQGDDNSVPLQSQNQNGSQENINHSPQNITVQTDAITQGDSLQNQNENGSQENIHRSPQINGEPKGDNTLGDDPPDQLPGNKGSSRPEISRRGNTPYSTGIPKDRYTSPRAETQGESNIDKQKDENTFITPGTTITLQMEWVMVVAAVLVLLFGNLYYKIYSLEPSNGKDCSCNHLFEKRIKSLETKVNTNTDRIDGLEKHTRRLDGEIERLDGVIKRLDVKVNDRMNMIEHDIRTLSSKLEVTENSLKQTMDSQNEELDRKIESQKEDLDEKIVEESKKSNSNLEASENRLNSQNKDLEGKITAEMDKLEELHNLIDTFDQRISDAENTVKEKSGEIEGRAKEMEEQMKNTSKRMQTMKERLTVHETDLDTAFANLFNKEVAMVVIVFLLMTDFGLIFAVYILCKGRSSDGSGTPGVRKKGPDGTFYNSVLDQIPVSPDLQYSVGVISFSKEYEPPHKHLIESVTRLLQGVAVRYHVILNNGNIRDIPHCRLIVICVEHSDRDVIIEESGYGLGDTNKTTLAAVQKLGAIPVIIYCKDLSSQRLKGDSLFHPRIRCATQQEELQPLSRDDRFFSVCDDFSPKQTEVFKRLIMQHVKRNSS